jgi:uncharacterized protein
MQPLIIGLDPGTKTAYAILDTNAEIIKVDSSKSWDFSNLLREIIKYGKPLLVGTDKKTAPNLVRKFSMKTGAKIISPDKDLTGFEKKSLVKIETKNSHEFDALASAFYAYEKIFPLIKKIESFLEKENKPELKEQIFSMLITDSGLSIKTALEKIEQKPVFEDKKKKRVRTSSGIITDIDENELVLLREENNELKRKIEFLKEKLENPRELDVGSKTKKLLYFKEQKILFLDKELKNLKERFQNLEHDFTEINSFLSEISNNFMAKKLDNFGKDEFNLKEKLLNIKKGDILLVDNINVSSESVIDLLRNKISIIIYKGKLSEKLKQNNFTFIPYNNLEINEIKNYAIVSKESLEKELAKKENIINIIKKYKEDRKK